MNFKDTTTSRKKHIQIALVWIVGGLALAYVAFSFYNNARQDPYHFSIFSTILVLGVLGFLFRQKLRTPYGLLELFLAFSLTSFALASGFPDMDSIWHPHVSKILQTLNVTSTISGFYFLIRAFDNIGKGLRSGKEKNDLHNHLIDENWEALVRGEAHRIWVKNGCQHGSELRDWEQAKRNIGRTKKSVDGANVWKKIFGF